MICVKAFSWEQEIWLQAKVGNQDAEGTKSKYQWCRSLGREESYYKKINLVFMRQQNKIYLVPNVYIECLPVMAASVTQYQHTSVTILILDINHLINVWEGSSGN